VGEVCTAAGAVCMPAAVQIVVVEDAAIALAEEDAVIPPVEEEGAAMPRGAAVMCLALVAAAAVPMFQAAVVAPAVAAVEVEATSQVEAAVEEAAAAVLAAAVTIDENRGQKPEPGQKSEPRTGDTMFAVGRFFDVDQRDLDAAAALGSRLQRGDVDVIGDAEAETVVVQPDIGDKGVGGIVGEAYPGADIEVNGIGLVG
jgi:hypothetical protein